MGQSEKSSSEGEVCLIADDDEFFRLALRSILTRTLGLTQVIETASLDEAVERLAEADNVSLALFDLAMPGMESAASLRAVRECFPTVRVAVVSASKRRSDMLLALEAGAHGYIPKGLGVAELAAAIKALRSGTIYVPASMADLSGAESDPTPLLGRAATAQGPSADESEPTALTLRRVSSASAPHLTPRQAQVLALLMEGLSNKAIARELGLGEGTVKVHIAALFRALGVTSRAGAAAAAARLLQPDPH
jgi:DNA-binding NarL/FixJ family response regulator